MTTVTPLVSPPLDDIRNAMQIVAVATGRRAFSRAHSLLLGALAKLGEPHPHTVELTRRYLEAACGRSVDDREARDFAQVVITSALKWEAP